MNYLIPVLSVILLGGSLFSSAYAHVDACYAKNKRPREVPDILIATGEENEDPRLDGIDLRESVRAIRVCIVVVDGRPIGDSPLVAINNRAADAKLKVYLAQDGSASILTAETWTCSAAEGIQACGAGRGLRGYHRDARALP